MLESEREKKKQANFFLPEVLLNELRRLVPPKQRSLVVAGAIEKELARMKASQAIGNYFGAWKSEEG